MMSEAGAEAVIVIYQIAFATPTGGAITLVPPLMLFGYGQGRVMAPLFGAVLANVRHAHAGAGSGVLTTTQQTANAAGVALVGLLYFTVDAASSSRAAILAALVALIVLTLCAALALRWMRRAASSTAGN